MRGKKILFCLLVYSLEPFLGMVLLFRHLFPAEKLFSHSHMTLLAACLNVACVNMAATKGPERFHISDGGQALGVCEDVILEISVQSWSDSDEHLLQICH